eukprot:m.313844 g.313844  ORF g.313844 m.313844 type:complete len:251 (-) comp55414_c0_seq5:108-860(-)
MEKPAPRNRRQRSVESANRPRSVSWPDEVQAMLVLPTPSPLRLTQSRTFDTDGESWRCASDDDSAAALCSLTVSLDSLSTVPASESEMDLALISLGVQLEGVQANGSRALLNIRVRNFGQDRKVAVHATYDAWETTEVVLAEFECAVSASSDRFVAALELPPNLSASVEFAVHLQTESGSFWDNKQCDNYRLSSTPKATEQSQPQPSSACGPGILRRRPNFGPNDTTSCSLLPEGSLLAQLLGVLVDHRP